MAKKTPHNIVNNFQKDFISLSQKIAALVESGVADGLTPGMAVDRAFKKLKIRDQYEKITVEAVKEAFTLGYGMSIADAGNGLMTKNAILSKRFSKDFSLRKSVWASVSTAKKEVTKIVADKLIQQQAWQKIATDVKAKELSKGTINKAINDLINASRKIDTNDPALVAQYKSKLKQAEKNIARLASNNAPTRYLKEAYQDVIDATKTFSDKAITKAARYASFQKMQYEAERVVRTEAARAYGVGSFNNFIEDADIIGVRSTLSSRHDIEDICNFYADADLFGMGAGIFPKNYAPPYPYHPHCMCILSPVYKGNEADKDDFDPDAGAAWIKEQTESMQKALLGVEGLAKFENKKSSWVSNLKNFELESKAVRAI